MSVSQCTPLGVLDYLASIELVNLWKSHLHTWRNCITKPQISYRVKCSTNTRSPKRPKLTSSLEGYEPISVPIGSNCMQDRCGLEKAVEASRACMDFLKPEFNPYNHQIEHSIVRQLTFYGRSSCDASSPHQGSDSWDFYTQGVFRQSNVMRVISKYFQVKEIHGIIADIHQISYAFVSISFSHVSLEQNREADVLAKLSLLDLFLNWTHIWTNPEPEVFLVLL